MIILSELRLWNDIERYCKVLDDIVVMPLEPESKYSISEEKILSKEEYTKRKNTKIHLEVIRPNKCNG